MFGRNPRIYLSPPHMSGYEQEYINEAFTSNWIAPLGPNVDAFETELAFYVGAKGAVALSSGTAGLHLALRLLGVEPGDVLFCSSFTFIASVNPVLYLGASPVFIDSEPDTWNMSPVALKKAFEWAVSENKLPKAVVVVDLYGQSADMDAILDICNSYDVPVVEDAAEALGSSYKSKACGTWGKFGVYSFNGNKIITTSGGGMLVGDDTEALAKARFWATQARNPVLWYEHSEMGYNYRLSNVLAGIGRGQLRVLEERVMARRGIYRRYVEAFAGVPGISFIEEPAGCHSNCWLTVMCIDPSVHNVSPVDVVQALEAENIESRPAWKPMHLQPLFKGCRYFTHYEDESFCDSTFATAVCLPSGSGMTKEEQDRVIDAVKRVISL